MHTLKQNGWRDITGIFPAQYYKGVFSDIYLQHPKENDTAKWLCSLPDNYDTVFCFYVCEALGDWTDGP